jgi:hypothetical protein
MGFSDGPKATAASFSFVHYANIPNLTFDLIGLLPLASAPSTLLSTLLRRPAKVTMHPTCTIHTSCTLHSLIRTPAWPMHSRLHTAQVMQQTCHDHVSSPSTASCHPFMICRQYRRRLQSRLTSAVFECVILAGSWFRRTKKLGAWSIALQLQRRTWWHGDAVGSHRSSTGIPT